MRFEIGVFAVVVVFMVCVLCTAESSLADYESHGNRKVTREYIPSEGSSGSNGTIRKTIERIKSAGSCGSHGTVVDRKIVTKSAGSHGTHAARSVSHERIGRH